jgi:regulator of sigma E protease
VLGILIIIHELGHYTVGRMLGFSIDAFSIGFGPKLLEKKGKYNLWQIRWILIGGYVKFKGELYEEEAKDDPGFFYNKKRWERFLVMVSGVLFNIIFAYLVFSFVSLYGIEESILRDKPPVVGAVEKDSPSEKAGISKGDIIVSIDGRKVRNWEEAKEEISSLMQKDYEIEVLRNSKKIVLKVSPMMVEFLKQPLGYIGVIPAFPPVIGGVQKDSPAEKAGLMPDDEIVSVNGVNINYWDEFSLFIKDSGGNPVDVKVKRGNEYVNLKVIPLYVITDQRYMIGINVKDSQFVRYKFPKNFLKAGAMTVQQALLAERTVEKIFKRKIPLKALSAPPSIAYITGKVARTGLYNLLFLMGVISFQLGFFNLLPIPALDGGQILVLAVEGAIRRDLPEAVKEWILKLGFGFLLLFFVLILFLDLFKYI